VKTLRTLILSFTCLAAFGCRPAAAPVAVSNRPSSVNDVRIPRPVTEISWTREDGTDQSLKDLAGKAVILDFWATYCVPCREEIPHLNQLQARYAGGLEIIGMHSGGDEDRPKIPAFMKETRIDYRLGFPDDEMLELVFDSDTRIPQTIVFDRQGRLLKRIVGFDESIKKELDAAVEQAVAQ
jgi:thiol-disulfide isomerase/thioredoxin